MSGSSKAGIVGGVVVAAGVGSARLLDDCGRVGARGARAIDDTVPRSVGLLDDAAPGARIGGAAELGEGVGRGLPGAPVHAEEVDWVGVARDGAIDIGVELLEADDVVSPRSTASIRSGVRCPSVVPVTREPEAWSKLRGGFGSACAPIVVVGTLDPSALAIAIDGEPTPIADVLAECAAVGARCMVAGCPADDAAACEAGVEKSLLATRLQPAFGAYTQELASRVLGHANAPVLLAQRTSRDGTPKVAVIRRR